VATSNTSAATKKKDVFAQHPLTKLVLDGVFVGEIEFGYISLMFVDLRVTVNGASQFAANTTIAARHFRA